MLAGTNMVGTHLIVGYVQVPQQVCILAQRAWQRARKAVVVCMIHRQLTPVAAGWQRPSEIVVRDVQLDKVMALFKHRSIATESTAPDIERKQLASTCTAASA
jgi:hypothetical protein